MSKRNNWLIYLYWLLPVVLFIFQAIYSSNMLNHIRQEELTESVSNVYWLQEFRNVCSGITTNIGWYIQLMGVYNIFGFSLATIKIYKLFLWAISLFCLASVLRRFLGERWAWLPLLTIGLSPTLIYFNSLSIHYGSDLIYFPICLYLLLAIKFDKSFGNKAKQIIFSVLSMIALMSYPTFIYYLPILAGVFLYKLINYKSVILRPKAEESRSFVTLRMTMRRKGEILFVGLVSFLAPLALGILYVKNRSTLFFDPATKSGLFRGNGAIDLNLGVFWENLKTLVSDLFYLPASYYFELAKVEFSDLYPVISIAFVFMICGYFYFKKKSVRPLLIALVVWLVINIILTSLTGSLAGVRRSTGVLAAFYALFCLSWYVVATSNKIVRYLKVTLMGVLVLLFVHHLFAFGANLNFLARPSNYREGQWFYQAQTPEKSLSMYIDQVTRGDLSLFCVDENRQPVRCERFGYNLIYPAIAGSCIWNNLMCHEVKRYDFETEEMVPLSLDCWRDDL